MTSSQLTTSTARFLFDLLCAQSLNVGAPDFDQALAQVVAARQELLAILAEQPPAENSA